MRITVDIDEPVLADLARLTGESVKSRAVNRAVVDFVRRSKMKEFGRLIREGAFSGAFEDDYDPERVEGIVAEPSPGELRDGPR